MTSPFQMDRPLVPRRQSTGFGRFPNRPGCSGRVWMLGLALVIAQATTALAAGSESGPPPMPPSPVSLFRELLEANPADRTAALARHPESQRPLLVAKLQEYERLDPSVREQRLQATEYLWYLRPLLATAPDDRRSQLESIPATYREVIRERVARWDALPESTRRDLRAYDRALNWLIRNQLSKAGAPPSPPGMLNRQLEDELTRWQALPSSHRDELCTQFESFFQLAPAKRQRALRGLPAGEQQLMEATLQAFNRLPPAQRALCIASFRKFATLSPAERSAFLRSAARWRELSPAEREEWRQLVTALPPLPPGFDSPPPLPPPPPPRPALASNGRAP